MSFRVIFLPRAQLDIANATAWLLDKSPAAANRWRLGLLSVVEKLEIDPIRYPLADESTDLGVELKEFLYGRRRGTYRILFLIDGEFVQVLRVRHSAQDP
jgi:plasmid stabilization system protein ParE